MPGALLLASTSRLASFKNASIHRCRCIRKVPQSPALANNRRTLPASATSHLVCSVEPHTTPTSPRVTQHASAFRVDAPGSLTLYRYMGACVSMPTKSAALKPANGTPAMRHHAPWVPKSTSMSTYTRMAWCIDHAICIIDDTVSRYRRVIHTLSDRRKVQPASARQ